MTPPTAASRPVRAPLLTLRDAAAPDDEVTEAAAAVAAVYCEPAKDVTTPAPLVARVMA